MKRYEGRREGYAVDVTVNGVPLSSPAGFV